jgi:hypothetical protein
VEQRLRVFEYRVLWRLFGPKRDDVIRGREKLHNKELRDLYSSPSIIKMNKSRRLMSRASSANVGEEKRV